MDGKEPWRASMAHRLIVFGGEPDNATHIFRQNNVAYRPGRTQVKRLPSYI